MSDKLLKTSIQVEPESLRGLKILYPQLTFSEIIRLAIDYVLAEQPELKRGRDVLVKRATTAKLSTDKSAGGKARAAKLSPERRKEIATLAAYKRWDPDKIS